MATNMDALFTAGAKVVFEHRGVQCWVKDIKHKQSPFKGSCNGYFRMFLPDIPTYDHLTRLFHANGGSDALPNGDAFTYMVSTGVEDERVIGFDGCHEHNKVEPLFAEEAQADIIKAVDFILDNGIGFAFTPRPQA